MYFFIGSVILISIIGTLAHFLYDISNHNKIVGLFCAVNESTWEHMKIALTPTLLWTLLDGFIYGTNPNYFLAKLASLFVIIILMPLLFYGHQFIFKKEIVALNIINFYIVIIVSQFVFQVLLRIPSIDFIFSYLSCIGLFLTFGGYMIHTLMPAKSFIFKDPITNKYGFKGHSEEFSIMKNKEVKKDEKV